MYCVLHLIYRLDDNYLYAIVEPKHIRIWASSNDAIESGHLSFRYFEVYWNLSEHRSEVLFRDSTGVTIT
jgi:hypothetical protein